MATPGVQPAQAAGLELDNVESLPLGMATLLVRVVGRWRGQPPRGVSPVLVIEDAGRPAQRFPALPGAFGAAPAAVGASLPFRAAFSIAAELEGSLARAKLDVGFTSVALPAPRPDAAEPTASVGNVIDRAVLAERRAARADSELMRLRERLVELEHEARTPFDRIAIPLEAMRRECGLARAVVAPAPLPGAIVVSEPGPITIAQAPAPADARPEPVARLSLHARPWLPAALCSMAREDPRSAARLLVELLPAQALACPGELDYDIELPETGWHRVDIADGKAAVMALERPRGRRRVAFRVRIDAPALARLLGEGPVRRPGRSRARVRATLRRRRALRALGPVPLGLAELARAEIWPHPGLVYGALAHAIEPAWTKTHRFCVAHEIEGPRGGSWYIHVDDGKRLAAVEQPPASGPHATVRSSQVAFQRLLGGELPEPGDKPAVSGDLGAVAMLTRWIEWAQGIGAPPSQGAGADAV